MECEEVIDLSDSEAGSDIEILGPEDLFNDEAEEGEFGAEEDGAKEKTEKLENEEVTKVNTEKKPKKVVKRPRIVFNYQSLSKPNGLPALKKLFADFKFKGNGHEKDDLTRIMGILQHWMCYQFCPSRDFESCMLELEDAGKKKNVQALMRKYRLGIDDWGESKSMNEEVGGEKNEGMDVGQHDEFDSLLNEEIANADIEGQMSPVSEEGETRTMGGENEKGPVVDEGETRLVDSTEDETRLGDGAEGETRLGDGAEGETRLGGGAEGETRLGGGAEGETRLGDGEGGETRLGDGAENETMPIDDKVEASVVNNDIETPQSAQKEADVTLTAEQLERIERNRKLAEERRMKRLTQQKQSSETEDPVSVDVEPMLVDDNT